MDGTVCDLLNHLLNFTRNLFVNLFGLFLYAFSPLVHGLILSLELGESRG